MHPAVGRLGADARRALAAYLAVRPASADDRLFLGAGGHPVGPQGVADLVAKHARRAGLDEVTPHTLRHTFARRLLDEGASLVDAAALLGHEQIETTAVDTRPHRRDLERAVERLASA